MSNFTNIWKKTYLGRLLSLDPRMGLVLSVLFVIYLCIHVFRLEMYPMYMFAMFSKQETPKELYHTYKIYNQDEEVNLNSWDYRRYTVLMNTIGQYDAILNNEMTHPEAEAIDKLIARLHLDNTSIKSKLKSSFKFSKSELTEKVGKWVGNATHVNPKDLRIQRVSYQWNNSAPSLNEKEIIYGLAE